MILLDTSVLIDYLRSQDPKLLATMQAEGAAICGVTRAEILHGARNAKHRTQLLIILNVFSQVGIPDAIWDEAGDLLATLRTSGVTIPFTDALLATLAIALDVDLWTRDKHFCDVQAHVPRLKLYRENLPTPEGAG